MEFGQKGRRIFKKIRELGYNNLNLNLAVHLHNGEQECLKAF